MTMERFYGCDRIGHIAQENPSCYRTMKKNTEDYMERKEEEAEKRDKTEAKTETRGTHNIPECKPDSGKEVEDEEEDDKEPYGKRQKKRRVFGKVASKT